MTKTAKNQKGPKIFDISLTAHTEVQNGQNKSTKRPIAVPWAVLNVYVGRFVS